MTENILNGMNGSEVFLLILIDLSRCSDVDHESLLQKLLFYQTAAGRSRSFLSGHVYTCTTYVQWPTVEMVVCSIRSYFHV